MFFSDDIQVAPLLATNKSTGEQVVDLRVAVYRLYSAVLRMVGAPKINKTAKCL